MKACMDRQAKATPKPRKKSENDEGVHDDQMKAEKSICQRRIRRREDSASANRRRGSGPVNEPHEPG